MNNLTDRLAEITIAIYAYFFDQHEKLLLAYDGIATVSNDNYDGETDTLLTTDLVREKQYILINNPPPNQK